MKNIRSRGLAVHEVAWFACFATMVASAPSSFAQARRPYADAAGNAAAQSVRVLARTPVPWPPHAAYPLKVSANRRYLVDQENVPVLLMGDSPQALTVNISEAEADMFFADREAHGFNGAWVNLLCGTYTGGRPDASTYDGIIPFTTPGDVSTPNEPFFARVDHMLRLAAQHG